MELDNENFYIHFGKAFLVYHFPSKERCVGKFGFFENLDLLSFNQYFIESIQNCIDYIDNEKKLEIFLDLYLAPVFSIPQSKSTIGVYVDSYNILSLTTKQKSISYYEYLLNKLPELLNWLVNNIKSIQIDNEKLKSFLKLKLLEFKKMMLNPANKHFKNSFDFVSKSIEEIINY